MATKNKPKAAAKKPKAAKTATAKAAPAAGKIKFGSPAWDAKYGIKKKTKKAK